MRILVIGGTRFVGRAYVETSIAAGHEVTLFNRGQTNADLFPDLERIRGDRGVDLSDLAGRVWDAVFDPACYLPRLARISAEALGDAAGHYAFVSSLSVYDDLTTTGQDESGHLATISDPTAEEISDDTYGPLKVLAELEVQRVFGARALIMRPGFITGPYDSRNRMPYWLRRVALGGEVLAPESPDYAVQLIDARDIARFALAMAERRQGGVFNLCAPATPYPMVQILESCRTVTGSAATFTWVSAEFLRAHGLDAEEALPYWEAPEYVAFTRFDPSKALAAGLHVRPLEESIRDTWSWDRARLDSPLRDGVGVSLDREAELLAAWRAR
jgi:2'-hydroxyisoflavone reductase